MNARELLAEASRRLELLPPEETQSLLVSIAAFLGEPVHIGDAIILTARSCGKDEWEGKPSWRDDTNTETSPRPEGLTSVDITSRYNWEGEVKESTNREYRLPELPARQVTQTTLSKGVVVPINGRRYRVAITSTGSDEGHGPSGATVIFTRTDDPESEFTPFDYEEERLKAIERTKAEVASGASELDEALASELGEEGRTEWAEYAQADKERATMRLWNLEHGEQVASRADVTIFGRPSWIQHDYIPVHNGKAAMCLAVLETGWGDAGNINILFACDEDGVPCRVWSEASCC
jgi:hypothetical protein